MLFRLVFRKILGNVAVAFEDVDHFKAIVLVTKQDDIVLESTASDSRSDALAGSAHLKMEGSEMMAVIPNLTVKSLSCSHTLTSSGDINEEIPKDQPWLTGAIWRTSEWNAVRQ
jgi:hypothetical protein